MTKEEMFAELEARIRKLEEEKKELLQAMFNDDESARYELLVKHGLIRKQKYFAVIDVETTGFANSDELTEIAVVKFNNDFDIVNEYESLIKPSISIPEHIVEKTGISDELVSNQREFKEVEPELSEFLSDCELFIAHNSSFDSRMLANAYARIDKFFNGSWVCTKELAKQHIESNSYSLANLCELLKIDLKSHHRAMPDALATFELYRKLKK